MTAAILTAKTPVRDRFAATRAAWRSILTHVQPEAEARSRLFAAADLAQRLDATLIGLGAEMIPPMAMNDPYGLMGGDFSGALAEAVLSNLTAAQTVFEAEASVSARQWIAVQDRPADAVERLARGADLIVAGGSPLKDRDSWRWADPAELVIKAGRPVLVVPPTGGQLSADVIVVAWKDSREARRALADAMPLLIGAEDVIVVEATESDIELVETHHDALIAHLKRHGVAARSRIVDAGADEAAEVLQEQRRAVGGDLIVAGAYGHTRFGEWVFGGVTADLLADPQRFLLLSH